MRINSVKSFSLRSICNSLFVWFCGSCLLFLLELLNRPKWRHNAGNIIIIIQGRMIGIFFRTTTTRYFAVTGSAQYAKTFKCFCGWIDCSWIFWNKNKWIFGVYFVNTICLREQLFFFPFPVHNHELRMSSTSSWHTVKVNLAHSWFRMLSRLLEGWREHSEMRSALTFVLRWPR